MTYLVSSIWSNTPAVLYLLCPVLDDDSAKTRRVLHVRVGWGGLILYARGGRYTICDIPLPCKLLLVNFIIFLQSSS